MHFLERAWYSKARWLLLLTPLSVIFSLVSQLRRWVFRNLKKPDPLPVPVIVIGNINVGGTGKTPLLIELVKALKNAGLNPGVVSHGYLSKSTGYPLAVTVDTDPVLCGDEALMIVNRTACPLVIDPNRVRACHSVIEIGASDVILSDDGLQHYRMHRDMEIAVVDGLRWFGNGMLMPAGPLREPIRRLETVQHIVVNGELPETLPHPILQTAAVMKFTPTFLVNLLSGEKKPFKGAPFHIGSKVHMVTGVGNPDRFYKLLSSLPYTLQRHDFPDHHAFSEADLDALGIDEHQPIVMTEKDAVKCRGFARANFWYLAADMKLSDTFLNQVVAEIKQLCKQRKPKTKAKQNAKDAARGNAKPKVK